MSVMIRKVMQGDEERLAHIQTESWKAAFSDILDEETLAKCADIEKTTSMYKWLLDEHIANGYILFVDDKPHCISYWDEARDEEFKGKAEIVCIHSLPDNWHKGYGSKMMDEVLKDIKAAGYKEAYLWVFKDNARAKSFYEAKGFKLSNHERPAFGAMEEMYIKKL
ncbi:MAG: GNAT family N-acetyltransferase [Lachnospiraceae bacterium]|nr:GNAT family N-acetyltransferase [Lachnospiraceae bacterium]